MTQVKFIRTGQISVLEEHINSFLKENKGIVVKDIKYQVAELKTSSNSVTAMIIYNTADEAI